MILSHAVRTFYVSLTGRTDSFFLFVFPLFFALDICIRVRSTHTYFIIFKWLASGQKKCIWASMGKSWQEDILETWWTKWWWWFSCRIVNVNIFSPGFQNHNVKIPTIYHVWHKNQSKTHTHPIKWSDFDKRNCFGFVGDFNTKRMLCLHNFTYMP